MQYIWEVVLAAEKNGIRCLTSTPAFLATSVIGSGVTERAISMSVGMGGPFVTE